MISNARGKHSSPGVYIEEIDKSYATKSLGITTLGVVGETLKGPAFEPVRISDWIEFQDYFGGTSTEKFKGTKYPKYELPYIAKSYLQESKQLEVCRVLGFSGYDAGPAWVIYGYKANVPVETAEEGEANDPTTGEGEANDSTTEGGETNTPTETVTGDKYVIAILRSKGKYGAMDEATECEGNASNDKLTHYVTDVIPTAYTSLKSLKNGCSMGAEADGTADLSVGNEKYGKFTLTITGTKNGETFTENAPVSLNPGDSNYIVNILGMDAQNGDYSIFVEDLYDLAHISACNQDTPLYDTIGIEQCETVKNYKEQFRSAMTPWFVSELKGNGTSVDVKKLFRFYTISDGNAANSQIKISIANILPEEGLFDVLIRDYHDTDNSPVILERFNKCNMMPGTSNYIGLQIGTYNGDYANKSKYVTVDVIENETTETCVPCGFLGYPLRKMNEFTLPTLKYNTNVSEYIKPNRQYFGMSDISGVDLDVLTYKGYDAYREPDLSNGFHLDSFINASGTGVTVACTVDGESGYTFTTPDADTGVRDFNAEEMPHITFESDMEKNIYGIDKRFRKFTCYPYGGFDGWDIYRESRTNTNKYRANKYKGALNKVDEGTNVLDTTHAFSSVFDAEAYGLSGRVINSDYYAYLAGYKQFDNPYKVKVNLFATPGIDYVNNLDLFNEVLDIIEESRQGDCLYVVTTPDADNEGHEIDALSAVSNLENQEISTSYAATYYPWVKYYDSANKKYINLPATKDVVRNFAYTDNVSHPWFASAGMSRGPVDCVKATHFTRQDEEDTLYEGMINPVKTFAADGVKIWGNKTMYQEDTPLNRINVRRLMIRVKDLVKSAATQLVFEQNDNTVDAQFRSIVEPILTNVKQNRGISDFRIKTDTSAEARDRKELPAAIHVKPIGCLEYIPITFTIYPEGAKFDE